MAVNRDGRPLTHEERRVFEAIEQSVRPGLWLGMVGFLWSRSRRLLLAAVLAMVGAAMAVAAFASSLLAGAAGVGLMAIGLAVGIRPAVQVARERVARCLDEWGRQ
jgi:hypothetical protein